MRDKPSAGPRLSGDKVVRTAEGAVVRLPARPERYHAKPATVCSKSRHDKPRGSDWLPPTPGAHAAQIDRDRVRISVAVASVEARCRPTHVRISIDVSSDPLPPRTSVYGISTLRRPLVVRLPDRLWGADVVNVSAVDSSGGSSESVGVLIRAQ